MERLRSIWTGLPYISGDAPSRRPEIVSMAEPTDQPSTRRQPTQPRMASTRGPALTRPAERRLRTRTQFCTEDAMDRLPFPGGRTEVSGVGHFHVSVQVGSRDGERFAPLDALVD